MEDELNLSCRRIFETSVACMTPELKAEDLLIEILDEQCSLIFSQPSPEYYPTTYGNFLQIVR